MNRIFVTGGNGFIGRHTVRELVARGLEVVAYDLVDPVERLDGVEYVHGTVMDKHVTAQKMAGCDAVLHLAAVLGVKRATLELMNCLNVNILGTVSVLEAAVLARVPNVLVTSSSEVFGDFGDGPYDETTQFNPKSAYAVTKLAAEEYALAFSRDYGLGHRIVRYFNIYGVGQSAEFVMPIFANRVARGEKIQVYGDGSQVRAFCNIRDAVRGTVDALLHPDCTGETFNIGNDGEPISMLALANLFVEIGGVGEGHVELVRFVDSDRSSSREIYRRLPDISKASRVLGYRPVVGLREGIAELIARARQDLAMRGGR